MRLTQATDYAMAAIIDLSQRNGDRTYSTAEISRSTEIPEEFLRKIFQVLVKSGVIRSFKGKGGGVGLARSPEDITVAEIIAPLQEERGLVRCLREGEYCPRSNECKASIFWRRIQENLFEVLGRTTIKDVLEGGNENAREN
ncbi:MAG: Rrf2 family transcriptional regulator [Candidatus Aerophobetes bacterium]